jgi:cysteine-rich repeat protein
LLECFQSFFSSVSCCNFSCQDINLVEFSSKILKLTADALAEFKLPPAESKSLLFINLQRQLLQSIGSSLTLSQAIKTSENLNSMLVPGLISGSRVGNAAVCASIVNLLALLGRKILYDSQLEKQQEQQFSQQLWNIAGGLLQLQTRGASSGFKTSASSDISFLLFDFYRVDSTSQRGSNLWTFSSTSQRKELGANFSIQKSIFSDTTLLDVVVAVQEFAWKTSDPNLISIPASTSISVSKKFFIVGAVYGLKIFDANSGYTAIHTLNPCMIVSITFDSLMVRQWVPQQRFAKVAIASYHSTSMMYSSDTCQTIAVEQDRVQSCCVNISQFAVKITPDATICGDGFADVENGEECDDGNLVDGDGCTKNCVIEKFYKCERSIPGLCTIVPANVTATCIPPLTCNGHGLYKGGSACICEASYFRANCSLKSTPLAVPAPFQNGVVQLLAVGLQFLLTSTPPIASATIAAFNDSDVQEQTPLIENIKSGDIVRSNQKIQFEFNPPIEPKDSIISIKLNVTGFSHWIGNPMLVNSNYSFFCLKLGSCLWTRMQSSINNNYVIQVTISSVDLPVIQRCAIFEFIPAYDPAVPGPADVSSLLVVYIGSASLAAALIAFLAWRKYKQFQAAKKDVQTSSHVHPECDVQANITPSKPSLSPIEQASVDDQLQIPSLPRELIEMDDLNVDVSVSDDAILSTVMQIDQSPLSETMSPVSPNRTLSLSPSGQKELRRQVSPPAAPRTPDGRRRPKVRSPLTQDIQGNSVDLKKSAQAPPQEKIRAAKSLSPTDRPSLKLLPQSMPATIRPQPSRRFPKTVASARDLQLVPSSQGTREARTGLSPTPKISTAVGASVTPGVPRIQRARVLRDVDDDMSPPRARIGLSDASIEHSPLLISGSAISLARSSLRDRQGDENESGVFQSAAIDIDNISLPRFFF